MTYPPVVIVDEKDKVVGSALLQQAWDGGLIHRIVFVIVEDSSGKILLHKRAPDMKLFAGRWDTAGGHVDVTPDYEQSARLELEEEVGLQDVELTKIAHLYCDEPYDNGVRAKRFITIYHCYSDELGTPGDGEATELRRFTKAEIAQLAADHPKQVAEGLHRCLPYILPVMVAA
jgi:8-oxo-dGTP pyrophosphatase MutT (NUDIX family)